MKVIVKLSSVEELTTLIHRAERLGFNMIDLYKNDDDELIAFTCSSSMKYIEMIEKVGVELKHKEMIEEVRKWFGGHVYCLNEFCIRGTSGCDVADCGMVALANILGMKDRHSLIEEK